MEMERHQVWCTYLGKGYEQVRTSHVTPQQKDDVNATYFWYLSLTHNRTVFSAQ